VQFKLNRLLVALGLAGSLAATGSVSTRAESPGAQNVQFSWVGFISPHSGQFVDQTQPLKVQIATDSGPDELTTDNLRLTLSSNGSQPAPLTLRRTSGSQDASGMWHDLFSATNDQASAPFGQYTLSVAVVVKGVQTDSAQTTYTLSPPRSLVERAILLDQPGYGYADPSQFTSVSQLQNLVSSEVSLYYDPDNGDQYVVGTPYYSSQENVLQEVLGKPAWLPDTAPNDARLAEIQKVVNALGWMQSQDYSVPELGLVKYAEDHPFTTSIGACGSVSVIDKAIAQEAPKLYRKAVASTAVVGYPPHSAEVSTGAPAPMTGVTAYNSPKSDGAIDTVQVYIGRGFSSVSLKNLTQLGPDLPVDKAELFVNGVSGGANSSPDVFPPESATVYVKPEPAGWTLSPQDWDWSKTGVLLGTTKPFPSKPTNGAWTTYHLNVPSYALKLPAKPGQAPAFAAQLGIQIRGQEPPPGWPPSAGAVASCGAWSQENGAQALFMLYHVNPSGIHVKSLHVDYTAIYVHQKSLDRQIAQAQAMLNQLNQALAATKAKIAPLQAAADAAQAKVKSLAQQSLDKQNQLRALLNTEPTLPKNYDNYVSLRDGLLTQLQNVQIRLDALPSTANPTALLKERSSLETRIAKYEALIESRVDKTDKTKEAQLRAAIASLDDQYWVAVRAQDQAVYDIELQQTTLTREQKEADDQQTVLDGLKQDRELLSQPDSPLVTRVTIYAGTPYGGAVVYDAQKWAPWDGLASVDAAIQHDQQDLAALAALRDQTRREYLDAEQATLAAGYTVYKAIWTSALAQAGVKIIYFVKDVTEAWSKTGPFGALLEAGKKLVDNYVFNHGNWFTNFDQTALEKSFDQEYNAGINQELNAPTTLSIGQAELSAVGKKVAKDLTTKPVKNLLSRNVASFAHAYLVHRWEPEEFQLAISLTVQAKDRAKLVAKIKKQVSQQKNLLSASGSLKKTVTDLVKKDLVEAFLIAGIKAAERAAWADFFLKDSISRAWARVFMDTSGGYWRQYDRVQYETELREQILQGFDPASGFQTLADGDIGLPQTDYIVLTLANPAGHQAEVTINGVQATPYGDPRQDTFSFNPGVLSPGAMGADVGISFVN